MELILHKLLSRPPGWPPGMGPPEDEGVRLAFFYREQEEAVLPAQQSRPWLARPFTDDEVRNFSSPWVSTNAETEIPSTFAQQTVPWVSRAFTDDEQLSVTAPTVAIEDESAWPPPPPEKLFWVAAAAVSPGLPNDEPWWVPPGYPGGGDGAGSVPAGAFPAGSGLYILTPAAFPVGTAFNDAPFTLPPQQSVPWVARVFADEEAFAAPTTFGIDQQDDFLRSVQAVPWLARPSVEQDEPGVSLKYFYREQEEAFLPAQEMRPWLAQFTSDEDAFIAPGVFYREQEDLPPAAQQAVPWLARPSVEQDEPGTQLRYFYRENEDWFPPARETIPWIPRPSVEQEEAFFSFGIDQEEAFLPAQQSIPWLPRPSADEEPGVGLANFYREQEDWFPPAQSSVPWTARPFAIDEALFFAAPVPVTPVAGWTVPNLVYDWEVPALVFRWESEIVLGWVVPAEAMNMAVADIPEVVLRRFPDWVNAWYFDFGKVPQILAGQTISSAVISNGAGDSTLVVGSGTVQDALVIFSASGGTAGATATVACAVTFSGGDVISWRGKLHTSN